MTTQLYRSHSHLCESNVLSGHRGRHQGLRQGKQSKRLSEARCAASRDHGDNDQGAVKLMNAARTYSVRPLLSGFSKTSYLRQPPRLDVVHKSYDVRLQFWSYDGRLLQEVYTVSYAFFKGAVSSVS